MKISLAAGLTMALMLTACAHTSKWDDMDHTPPPAPAAPATSAPLKQLSAAELQARLGKPDFTHQETDSQIWRYDLPGCRILFYMYPEGGSLRVREFQDLPDGKPGHLSQTCREAVRTKVKLS